MAQIIRPELKALERPPIFGIGESRYADYILNPNITYVDKTDFIKVRARS